MRRSLSISALFALTLFVWATPQISYAQPGGAAGEKKADKPAEGKTAEPDVPPADDIPEPDAPPPVDDVPPENKTGTAKPAAAPAPAKIKLSQAALWKDIAVLQRKQFLKRKRIEITPFVATTINDPIIQHTGFGADINYFLTDILAIGVQGMYYVSQILENEFWVRNHLRRVPSVNKYTFSVSGNFSYVPIYGKFAVFNDHIFHWEIFVSGGVGVTGTEVIPRNLENESFSNIALTFPLAAGLRFFFNRWLAVTVTYRDYLMIDKFEAPNRSTVDGEIAKNDESETGFVNNMTLSFGISVFFPMGFEYTTFR